MNRESKIREAAVYWTNQPKETTTVDLNQLMNRRSEEFSGSTRVEILTSIGAALFFAAVMAWRLPPGGDRIPLLGYGAILVWVTVSLWWSRHRIWPSAAARADVAESGLTYYRKQLEARRNHLRNGWIWHGPLVLAGLFLLLGFYSREFFAYRGLGAVMPLVMMLEAWIGLSLWRRWRLAREIQREIEELGE